MSGILFKPNGSLDLSSDPTEIPDDGLSRCKNIRLDHAGKVVTRDGSTKLNATALDAFVDHITIQGGDRYSFSGGKLYKNESSLGNVDGTAGWTSIQYNAYNSEDYNIYATNGSDSIRIQDDEIDECGMAAPSAACTIKAGPSGNLSGYTGAKYSYLRKEGTTLVSESDLSPAVSNTVNLSSNVLMISGVTKPSDTQVTHIRFYRNSGGGTTYYPMSSLDLDVTETYDFSYMHDWEEDDYISGDGYKFTHTDSTNSSEDTKSWEDEYDIENAVDDETFLNSSHEFSDSTITIWVDISDANLGTVSESTAHDRLPAGTSYLAGPNYNGYCFAIVDNKLYYCLAKRPEYWPVTYYIEVSPPQYPGKCLIFYNGQPYYFTTTHIYLIQGTGHNSFFPMPMPYVTGVTNKSAACVVPGAGIAHLANDGLYFFDGASDTKLSLFNFEAIFRGETVRGVPGVSSLSTAWMILWHDRLYVGYASDGYDYPTNCIVLNMSTKRATYYNWNDIQISAVCIDNTNDWLIAGDSDGYVWRLENSDATTDNGTAIDWDLQTKEFTLQTRAHFPRWVKYDIDASDSSCTATGELYLDDEVKQSHSITGNRNTKRRLVTSCNGERLSHRIYGSGVVKIYAIESE